MRRHALNSKMSVPFMNVTQPLHALALISSKHQQHKQQQHNTQHIVPVPVLMGANSHEGEVNTIHICIHIYVYVILYNL
jgi:hypothetical protein